MTGKGLFALTAVMLALLISGVAAPGVVYAEEFKTILGVVEDAGMDSTGRNSLTLRSKVDDGPGVIKTFDVTGAPVTDDTGEKALEIESGLRGKIAEIVLQPDGQIVSIKIYPPPSPK